MIFNKVEDKPQKENPILIVIDQGDFNSFNSGWYDLGEESYFDEEGDELDNVIGWVFKPDVEFN